MRAKRVFLSMKLLLAVACPEGGNSFDFDIVWEFWVLIAAAVVWSEESNIVSFEGFYEVVGVESCSSEGIGWKLKCEEEDVEFAHGFSSVQ